MSINNLAAPTPAAGAVIPPVAPSPNQNQAAVVLRTRMELGDLPKSFVQQMHGDGHTRRFQLSYAPVDAETIIVQVGGVDVSDAAEVEETEGVLMLEEPPPEGAVIVVAGTHYRFFTTLELETICTEALATHAHGRTDASGRPLTWDNLSDAEHYPLTVFCTIHALYTLLTDASFDIDVLAPDGVSIPRSERYRQLLELIQLREQQYKDLSNQLGIGLYSVQIFTLRRISKRTGRYVPVYLPQEVDDASAPQRANLPLPTYGSEPEETTAAPLNLNMYQGDTFRETVVFPVSVALATLKADIRGYPGSQALLAQFTITPIDQVTVEISLTPAQTKALPKDAKWDMQARFPDGTVTTFFRGDINNTRQITVN